MDKKELAESVKRYLRKYNAMVLEGEYLAGQKRRILRGNIFDSKNYIKIRDCTPALAAWRNAQCDSVDIINALVDLVGEMVDTLKQGRECSKNGFPHIGQFSTQTIFEENADKIITKVAPIAEMAKE